MRILSENTYYTSWYRWRTPEGFERGRVGWNTLVRRVGVKDGRCLRARK